MKILSHVLARVPTNINYRANIWALKQEGCTHVIVSTACGSLQEEIAPGDLVLLDQFIDRTTKRIQTFYDGTNPDMPGICHLPADELFCVIFFLPHYTLLTN